MDSKLMRAKSLLLVAVFGGIIMVGCGESGPNDPTYTSAEIQKMRAAVVKPSDGPTPTYAPAGRKR